MLLLFAYPLFSNAMSAPIVQKYETVSGSTSRGPLFYVMSKNIGNGTAYMRDRVCVCVAKLLSAAADVNNGWVEF